MLPLLLSLLAMPAIASPQALPPTSRADPRPSLAPLVQAVSPAVVAVVVEGVVPTPQGDRWSGTAPSDGPSTAKVVQSEGSGFVVRADGLVVTNEHLVRGAGRITVRFDDATTARAEVIGTDTLTDVALLKLIGERTWPAVELADSDALQVGDWVVAMGNPLGLGTTVTVGIVSGKGRRLGDNPYDEFLQTDAAINQGNSGGPLFDLDGRVVGMNSAIIRFANTVGFSIPSTLLRRIIDDLEDDGRVSRGYAGLVVQALDEPLAKVLGLPDAHGALLTEVQPDQAAERARLRSGDVVTAVNGRSLQDSGSLIRILGLHRPGDTVVLEIWRDGRRRTVDLTLGQRPEDSPLVRKLLPPVGNVDDLLGIAVRNDEQGQGVQVIEVAPAGPAAGSLAPGDLIVAVNRSPTPSVEAFTRSLRTRQRAYLLEVLREGTRRYVAFSR